MKKLILKPVSFLLMVLTVPIILQAAPSGQTTIPATAKKQDLLFEDFEGESYGEWVVSGDAFGAAPAKGKIGNQQDVTGFKGSGLVNTFRHGDRSTGSLTSPAFTIQHDYISFLIGGGSHKETCIQLIVDDVVVASVSGKNSETLELQFMPVEAYRGKEARLKIVDSHTGGWGHVNVDHIVFTDSAPNVVKRIGRDLRVDAPFLQLPLIHRENAREGGERFTIEDADGNLLRYFHAKFPAQGKDPDFWYSYDVREFQGKEVIFRYTSYDNDILNRLELSSNEIIDKDAYSGMHRPRFHFSPRIGWMNDINGVYYKDGLYHLFYQYNPTSYGGSVGFDMHWGHSVSKNLVHWEEWPIALFPDKTGNMYSGTALLLDKRIEGINDNSSLPTPVLFYTATDSGQCLATGSEDARTWTKHPDNPVLNRQELPGSGRDPKVIWHEESGHYVMLVWAASTEVDPEGFAIFRSKNLINWERVGLIPHWYECPEFIPMKSAVTGETLWLLYGFYRGPLHFSEGKFTAPSAFQLGTFDGTSFKPVSEVKPAHLGPHFYAALIFMNAPDKNPVMMGWARGPRFPGEVFNQCATVPLELSLRNVDGEDELYFYPIPNLEKLRETARIDLRNVSVEEANRKLLELPENQPYDVVLTLKSDSGSRLQVSVLKNTFSYRADRQTVGLNGKSTRKISPGESIEVRFLIDRGITESFWNQGQAIYSVHGLYEPGLKTIELDGDMTLERLVVYPLKSIW